MPLDALQQRILEYAGGYALVLGGPGCGKTHLLTRRTVHALAQSGMRPSEMLCVTFTNRAAREMSRRLRAETGSIPDGLYVGNLHRLCARLLYRCGLIAPSVSILDSEDRDEWLESALGLRSRSERKQLVDLAVLEYQKKKDFPHGLRRRLGFTPSDSLVLAAGTYAAFKRANCLVDFDDLLLLTYEALASDSIGLPRYRWLQVDEVQDFTPLQLAIVDLLTAETGATVMYFGDERQAIFEFAGAGGPALDRLKLRCASSTFRLAHNYRSSAPLANLCRAYGELFLGLENDCDALSAVAAPRLTDSDAVQLHVADGANTKLAVSACIRDWLGDNDGAPVAVLTRTNDCAGRLSAVLTAQGIEHTLVARTDLFHQLPYKTLCSHLAAVAGAAAPDDWARLMLAAKVVANSGEARSAARSLAGCNVDMDHVLSEGGIPGKVALPVALQSILTDFTTVYGPVYRQTHMDVCVIGPCTPPAGGVATVLDTAYSHLTAAGLMNPLAGWERVAAFISDTLGCTLPVTGSAISMTVAMLPDLRTFNETDMVLSQPTLPGVTVMTVHKAKGMEFDRVIFVDSPGTANPHGDNADIRVHYVAFSRARKRLAVFCTDRPSASLSAVLGHFRCISPDRVEASALLERLHAPRHRR